MVKKIVDIIQPSTVVSHICLSLYVLLGLSGCAAIPLADSPVEPRRLGREFPISLAPPEPEATSLPFAEPAGALTLRSALAAALLNSPALAAFSWEVRAREGRALQAGLLPNPVFRLELEEFGGGGRRAVFDGAEAAIRLRQLLELGGKRAKRQQVETLNRDLAAWDYETLRLDVFTEVMKAFVTALSAQERVTLAEEQVRLAEEAVQTVARRSRLERPRL